MRLQQHLPFTVLKQNQFFWRKHTSIKKLQQHLPFTVLKLSGGLSPTTYHNIVATALTVYGIETLCLLQIHGSCHGKLQQHLPFTVLKPAWLWLEKI